MERIIDCYSCNRPIMPWDAEGTIDGEAVHATCVFDELDEIGMDDEHK